MPTEREWTWRGDSLGLGRTSQLVPANSANDSDVTVHLTFLATGMLSTGTWRHLSRRDSSYEVNGTALRQKVKDEDASVKSSERVAPL